MKQIYEGHVTQLVTTVLVCCCPRLVIFEVQPNRHGRDSVTLISVGQTLWTPWLPYNNMGRWPVPKYPSSLAYASSKGSFDVECPLRHKNRE